MKNSKINQIAEGITNHIIPPKDQEELITLISKQRLEICNNCEFHSKNHFTIRPDDHCTNCGCNLILKTKCLSCECPLEGTDKKWFTYETNN